MVHYSSRTALLSFLSILFQIDEAGKLKMHKHVLGKFAKACVRKHFSAASDSRGRRCPCECEDPTGFIDLSDQMPADEILMQCVCTSCGPQIGRRGQKQCQMKIVECCWFLADGLCEDCRSSGFEILQRVRLRELTIQSWKIKDQNKQQ